MPDAGVPEKCTTCGTLVPPGRARCPGCGRVFGEDNRCPSCHAVAAVNRVGSMYVCAACTAPRDRLPGTVVLGEDRTSAIGALMGAPAGGVEGRASVAPGAAIRGTQPPPGGRGSVGALRFLGVFSLGATLTAAVTAAIAVPGALGIVLATMLAGWGVTMGFFALRAASRRSRRADASDRAYGEQRILALAAQKQGVLTATDVAQALGGTLAEADRALTAMADGSRVSADVDDEGILRYRFREMEADARAKVRVAEPVTATPGAEAAEELAAEPPPSAEQASRKRPGD